MHQLETTLLQWQAAEVQTLSKEPKISLPAKFDGTRSQFRGFLNQVRLVIKLHPSRYPTYVSRVGLVGTLLIGTALSWFAPLLERHSPLLEDFEGFVNEFQANFGNTDRIRTAVNKIRRLREGDCPASAYVADFRLLACDIPWDKEALIYQFGQGLRNDVKDLLLTFHTTPRETLTFIRRFWRIRKWISRQFWKHW